MADTKESQVSYPSASINVYRWMLWTGIIFIVLGVIAILGWYLHIELFVRLFIPYFEPLQFNSALAFFVWGIGIIGVIQNRRKLAITCGYIVLTIGSLTALQHIFSINLGIDNLFVTPFIKEGNTIPGRMSFNVTLNFIAAGLSLIFLQSWWFIRHKHRQLILRVLGAYIMGSGLTAFFSYLLGVQQAFGLIHFTKMDPHTVPEFLFLGLGLLVYAWTYYRIGDELLPRWLPAPVTLSLLAGTIFLWHTINNHELAQIFKNNQSQALNVKTRIITGLRYHINAMERMVHRWEVRTKMSQYEWEQDAQEYLNDQPGLQTIQLFDPSYKIKWEVKTDRFHDKDLPLQLEELKLLALERSKSKQKMVLTQVVIFDESNKHFMVYAPLYIKQNFSRFLVGIFDVNQLIDSIVLAGGLSKYWITIFDGNNIIYGHKPLKIDYTNYMAAESLLKFHGLDWKLVIWPKVDTFIEQQSALAKFVLVAGIFMSLFVFSAVFFGATTFNHSIKLSKALSDLHKSKKETEVILHSMSEGVFGLDNQGKIVFVNPAGSSMVSIPSKRIIGKIHSEFLHITKSGGKTVLKKGESPISSTCSTGVVQNISNLLIWRNNGSSIPVDFTSAPIWKNNKLEGAVVVFRDIEKRKRAETEAKETQRRLRSIIDNASSLIYVKDISGRILTTNKQFQKLLNKNEQSLTGKTNEDLFPRHYSDKLTHNDQIVIKSHNPNNFEEVLLFKNREHTFISTKFPLYDSFDNMYAICGISTDITDRKNDEIKLQEYTKRLEIANEQLEEARHNAEKANYAKSAFLANMSHEIRTPLNGVIGMTSLLSSMQLTEKQSKYVSRISLSGKVLLEIINDILDFSKIEAGEIKLEEISCNFPEILKETGDMLNSRAEEKGLELITRFAPGTPSQVIIDPTRFRQILTNLVSNAIKFTEEGYVFIDIKCKNIKDNEALFHIEIQDTGIGIPEEKLHLIFEKFSQADISTTRKFGGTGLGLAITKQLVEMMKGRIGCESHEGKGTTFWIEIPFKLDKSNIVVLDKPAFLKEQHVLIVEDNHLTALILKDYLHSLGIESVIVKTLDEIKEKMLDFTIVIVDYKIEKKQKESIFKKIKAYPNLKNAKFILLASLLQNSTIDLKKLNYTNILTKPIYIKELSEELIKLFQENKTPKD